MGIRCFIAVNLNDAVREDIESSISALRTGKWDVKWVPGRNLHITLKFLGNIPEESVGRIIDKLSLLSSTHQRFSVGFRGVGVFPGIKKPRVVWIDIIDHDKLKKLQEQIEVSMSALGFERDARLFSPHLTVGRLRSFKGADALIGEIEKLSGRDFGNIEVEKISLMRSDLKPAGAQYTALAEFRLNRRINDQ